MNVVRLISAVAKPDALSAQPVLTDRAVGAPP